MLEDNLSCEIERRSIWIATLVHDRESGEGYFVRTDASLMLLSKSGVEDLNFKYPRISRGSADSNRVNAFTGSEPRPFEK